MLLQVPFSAARITMLLCCLITVLEGFDLQAAGVAAPKLAAALAVDAGRLGGFFSAGTLGLMLGAVAGGRLSDRVGRKRVLLLSMALFALLSLLTGLSQTFNQLLLARFVTGVGLGGALPNLIALAAEATPLHRRGGAIGLLYAGMPVGGALASLTSLIGSGPQGWRVVFLLGGLLPLLLLPLVARRLPDSERAASAPSGDANFAQALFGEHRAVTTLLLWLGQFFILLTVYLLLNWLPSLLIGRGLSRNDAALMQTLFNLAGAGGAVVAGHLMDRGRWRLWTAAGLHGAAILCLLAVAAATLPLPLWLCLSAGLGVTVLGCQSILYGLAQSSYPRALRGSGVGAAVAVGRSGSVLGPLLAGLLLSAGQSASQVLLALLPVMAVSGLVTSVLAKKPVADR
jgi:AAHS family 3-hydroxyphenylpropionic acid transporter